MVRVGVGMFAAGRKRHGAASERTWMYSQRPRNEHSGDRHIQNTNLPATTADLAASDDVVGLSACNAESTRQLITRFPLIFMQHHHQVNILIRELTRKRFTTR